jgi:hypothetical protein
LASRDDADEATSPKASNIGKADTGAAGSRRAPRKRTESHVGNALRSAYDEAVREDVPDEFLDLLKKLS